jgi:hypothetical protein
MKHTVSRKVAYFATALGLAFALFALAWLRLFPHGPPPGLLLDARAGLPARAIKDPDARLRKYLDNRYGSMADSANRQQVFLDFFEPERIKVLQLLVQHSPEDQRQANIDAMARWVESYRAGLTGPERADLRAMFQTAEGQTILRRATAQYNAQDVRYRGSTAPVISQLLRTISEVEQAR